MDKKSEEYLRQYIKLTDTIFAKILGIHLNGDQLAWIDLKLYANNKREKKYE